jgi:hypothetical protein
MYNKYNQILRSEIEIPNDGAAYSADQVIGGLLVALIKSLAVYLKLIFL